VYDVSNGTIFNDLQLPLPDFKVTPLFDAEYLRNGVRDTYMVSMEGRTHNTQGCHFE